METIICRKKYLEKITSLLDRDMMLILTGQRRVGKSFMLKQVKCWLEDKQPTSNIIYINKEFKEFSEIKDSDNLYDYINQRLSFQLKNYLLIDEVQDIVDYELALRSLHAERKCQIIATGSNAYIFSSELSTKLSGRYIEIPIHSLSYTEFLEFHKLEDSEKSLISFLRVGGLPGLCHFDIHNESQVFDYIQGVYNTVMVKDILTREKVRNVEFIENLSTYIADNIGKIISAANIGKFMKTQLDKVSEPLIGNYLSFLCNAFLISKVNRYDIHGKKIFEYLQKYYFADHGIRNLLCGFNIRGSIEKVMENVIYNHLLINDWQVKVGILRIGEIDFVATKGSRTIYIQSTYQLSSEETIIREFGNLAAIKNNYQKFVVSMDPLPGELPDYPGIIHIPLHDFLTTPL